MGMSPPSKLVSTPPSKPYRPTRLGCSLILQRLIWGRDWQRVLIRARLYPSEVSIPIKVIMDGSSLSVLPLHLVCALNPPVTVVNLFLELHPIGAVTPIRVEVQKERKLISRRRRSKNRPIAKLFHSRLSFDDCSEDQRFCLIPKSSENDPLLLNGILSDETFSDDEDEMINQISVEPLALPEGMDHTIWYDSHQELDEKQLNSLESVASMFQKASDSSKNVPSLPNTVILKLSHSGDSGLVPMLPDSSARILIHSSATTSETLSPFNMLYRISRPSSSSSSHHFQVVWDNNALRSEVEKNGACVLPLHIAIFYQANVDIIGRLIDAAPNAVLSPVLGMLPIHWVASGFSITSLNKQRQPQKVSIQQQQQRSSSRSDGLPLLSELAKISRESQTAYDPFTLLLCLKNAMPETTRVQCGHNFMTPLDYLQDCMEEGTYKEKCRHILKGSYSDTETDDDKNVNDEVSMSISFIESTSASTCSDDLTSEVSSTISLFLDSDSSSNYSHFPVVRGHFGSSLGMITGLIEEHKWQNVYDLIKRNPNVASRWLYGVEAEGPGLNAQVVWKRLPLHLACLYSAPVNILQILVKAYPTGVSTIEPNMGRLPLHCMLSTQFSFCTVLHVNYLLQMYPEAIHLSDRKGRLPLHLSVLNRDITYDVVESLIEWYPYAVIQTDRLGKTPLDLAKESRGPNDLVSELMEQIVLIPSIVTPH